MGLTQETELSRPRASQGRFALATALLTAFFATACGNGTEVASEWETIWGNTLSAFMEASTSAPSEEQCQDMLGYLRVQRTVLSPVPLEDLEPSVDRWFREAESVFFDCDLADEAAQESLETLEAIEAEVEAVLEVEG